MRQSGPQRRGRGRPSGRRGFNNSPNRSYDSSGPEVKIRGTASTVFEKYQTLARDAVLSGDRVAAENYFQHAEHYYRVMQATKQQAGEGEQRADQRPDQRSDQRPDQRSDQRPDQRNDQRDNRGRNQQAGQQNSDGRGDDAAAGANANITAIEDVPTAVNADAPSQAGEVTTDTAIDTAIDTTANTTAANTDIPVVVTADAVTDTPDNQSADTAGAVDREERSTPMNPAELAAMSGGGRKPRRSSKANGANNGRSDVSADSDAKPDAKPDANLDASSDDNADVSEPVSQPAPRRAPRRRPAPALEAAATDVEATAAPVIEDVESS